MSYDRGHPVAFVRSRLLRLGVPLLVFFFLVIPAQQYLCHRHAGDLGPMSFGGYYRHVYFGTAGPPTSLAGPGRPEMNFGHLWYVEHLLIFSLCYAGLRALWKRPSGPPPAPSRLPAWWTILLFALALAGTSAVVRIWYPIDKWIGFLGFIQVAFADVPRDLSFFILGALAYRRQWLLGLSERAGRAWLLVGLAAAALWYIYSLRLWRVWPIPREVMNVAYPLWEALFCCAICIGLLYLFRARLNQQGRWGRALAQSQYGAYLVHVPVVVLVQYAVVAYPITPFSKFLLVTALSTPLAFLLADGLRRPPLLRRIL